VQVTRPRAPLRRAPRRRVPARRGQHADLHVATGGQGSRPTTRRINMIDKESKTWSRFAYMWFHTASCGTRAATDNEDAERLCTCEPMTLTVGDRA
jgi:hypothetical protein